MDVIPFRTGIPGLCPVSVCLSLRPQSLSKVSQVSHHAECHSSCPAARGRTSLAPARAQEWDILGWGQRSLSSQLPLTLISTPGTKELHGVPRNSSWGSSTSSQGSLVGTDIPGSVGWGWQILGMLPGLQSGQDYDWALPAAPWWFTALLISLHESSMIPGISRQDPLVLRDAQLPFPSLAAPLAP